eukprot:SAG31_NODE_5983_length_2227_cov_1.446898_1_plen_50_part_00
MARGGAGLEVRDSQVDYKAVWAEAWRLTDEGDQESAYHLWAVSGQFADF